MVHEMSARHREQDKRTTIGAWILRRRLDLFLIGLAIGVWLLVLYRYTN